jgi:uncharacterized protein (TIGR02466 family)
MEIANLFPTPLIIIDASSILNGVENIFDNSTFELRPDNFKTSLKMWRGGKGNVGYTGNNDIGAIKEFILENAKAYLEHAGYNLEGVELEVPNIWCNEMVSGATQNDHNHVGCLLSGCIYLEVPDNGGVIKFCNPATRFDRVELPIKKYNEYTSDWWAVNPKVGQLLMWPSHIVHGVPASNFEGVRRSVAFDVTIKEFYE